MGVDARMGMNDIDRECGYNGGTGCIRVGCPIISSHFLTRHWLLPMTSLRQGCIRTIMGVWMNVRYLEKSSA